MHGLDLSEILEVVGPELLEVGHFSFSGYLDERSERPVLTQQDFFDFNQFDFFFQFRCGVAVPCPIRRCAEGHEWLKKRFEKDRLTAFEVQ